MESHISEVLSRLARIEEKQDSTLRNQKRMEDVAISHDSRIRQVEKSQSRMLGYGAGALGLWSVIVAGISTYFKMGG